MGNMILGLFIGLLVGANLGILGTVIYAAKKETVRKLEKLRQQQNSPETPRRISASDIFILRSCDHCGYEWKEHPIAMTHTAFCPHCGKCQCDDAVEDAV